MGDYQETTRGLSAVPSFRISARPNGRIPNPSLLTDELPQRCSFLQSCNERTDADKKGRIGEQTYSTDEQALVMIYPNPLNPKHYIVINSGFNFSKFSGGSNSLQIPKLPDWAVIDLVGTQDSQYPVGVIDAGFF